ncbi:hypothetical protein Z945_681 [Sulfitobacter noctilucae]|nr:hypothetical protein Z945_681 [Sulfitobacter noctilucae]
MRIFTLSSTRLACLEQAAIGSYAINIPAKFSFASDSN